ncbi:MAG: hypothetical protein ACKVTZ_23885 [Bacteroidia bacterium]
MENDQLLHEFRYSSLSPLEKYEVKKWHILLIGPVLMLLYLIFISVCVKNGDVYFLMGGTVFACIILGVGVGIFFPIYHDWLDKKRGKQPKEEGEITFHKTFLCVYPREKASFELQYEQLEKFTVELFHHEESLIGVQLSWQIENQSFQYYPELNSDFLLRKMKMVLKYLYEKNMSIKEYDNESKKPYYLFAPLSSNTAIEEKYQKLIDEIGEKEEN